MRKEIGQRMTNLSKEEGQGCSPVDKYNAGLGKIGG